LKKANAPMSCSQLVTRFATTEEVLLASLAVIQRQSNDFICLEGHSLTLHSQAQGVQGAYDTLPTLDPSVLLLERLRQHTAQFRTHLLETPVSLL
jgi:hypothetical protein